MYKYYIACTNPLLTAGISALISACAMDVSSVGRGENEKKAFEQIQTSKPDLILADTALTAEINDHRPDVVRLRETICREMKDKVYFIYLLHHGGWKPSPEDMDYAASLYYEDCDAACVSTVLNEAFNRIDAYQREMHLLGQGGLAENDNILLNHYLLRLLNGANTTDHEARERLQKSEILCPGSCFQAIEISLMRTHEEMMSYALYQKLMLMVKQRFNQLSYNFVLGTGSSGKHICVVLISKQPIARSEIAKSCRSNGQEMATLGLGYFQIDPQYGVGVPVDTLSSLSYSNTRARAALRRCEEENGTVCFGEDLGIQNMDFVALQNQLDSIFAHRDIQKFSAMLVELERQIRTMPRNAAIHCLSVLTQEYLTCEKDAQTSLTRALDCEQAAGPSGWVMLYGFQNSEELDNYLIKLGTLICGCLLREQRRNKRDLLARAKEYIQEHVTEAPALSEVAEKIGVSQNYLSVLFRRENTGFTEYMTEQRIAKACEMIRSGEGKISEISEKVGYTTPQYFSKVFKKVMGVRPSEYEQRMTGGHQNDTDL